MRERTAAVIVIAAVVVAGNAFGRDQDRVTAADSAATSPPPSTAAAAGNSSAPGCALRSYAAVATGASFTMSWTTDNAPVSGSLKLGETVVLANPSLPSGSRTLTAPAAAGKYTYTMEVTNGSGSQTCKASVETIQPLAATPHPHAFVWTGIIDEDEDANEGNEPSNRDIQMKYIASHYSVAVFNKVHANWDIAQRHLDAQRLKAFNPNVKLLSYYGMRYRFLKDQFGTVQNPPVFQPPQLDRNTPRQPTDWRLMDSATGQPIPFVNRTGNQPGWWVDLSNPDYRAWALATFAAWFAAAPYDGIAFDNAPLIPENCAGPPPKPECLRRALRDRTLPEQRVKAVNEGEKQLLQATRNVGGKPRLVLFNGIAQERNTDDRQLALLDYSDMALNEFFCLSHNRRRTIRRRVELKADIDLMLALGARGKTILANTKGRTAEFQGMGGMDKVARFCYGAFLMGYVPNRHYFMFVEETMAVNQWQAYENVKEFGLTLGDPQNNYDPRDAVWSRTFQNGMVLLNPDRASHTVKLPRAARLMNGNIEGPIYPAGAEIAIPAQDAYFFLNR